MTNNIYFILAGLCASLPIAGCEIGTNSDSHLEKVIRNEVLREAPSIASLTAIYALSFVHYQENNITSDDFFIQKDIVNIDYGYDLDDNSIQIVDEAGIKKLKVRLGNGSVLAVNRITLDNPVVSHDGYVPINNKTGERVNIDEKMNVELDELKKAYEEKNLKHAKENAKNFFRILATKYGLTLDFE